MILPSEPSTAGLPEVWSVHCVRADGELIGRIKLLVDGADYIAQIGTASLEKWTFQTVLIKPVDLPAGGWLDLLAVIIARMVI